MTTNTFNESAEGVYLITVTPFKDNGELDLASTDRMVDFCLERGVTGLTILGIMGENTKLTAEESRQFTRQVLARVQGKVPVVVGASSAGFAPMSELTKSVMDMGAAGVMIALFPPAVFASGLAVWLVLFFSTRYVSVASLGAAIALPTASTALLFLGKCDAVKTTIAFLMCVLAVWRHRSNISRLIAGTEKRFEKKPPAISHVQ